MISLDQKLTTCIIGAALLLSFFIPFSCLYASERQTLKIGLYTNKPPFTFLSMSKETIGLRGACVDILGQISHHLNADFKYIKSSDSAMTFESLKSGKIDIAGMTLMFSQGPFSQEFKSVPVGLNLTSRIFVHKSCNTIVCEKDLSQKRVAIIGFSRKGWNSPFHVAANAETFPFTAPVEALHALNKGLVDAFIAPSEKLAAYIIRHDGLENVKRVGMPIKTIPLAISVRKENEQLYHDLIKAVAKTKASGTIRQIKEKWFGVDYKQSFLEKYNRLILVGIGLFLLVLAFVMTWNHQLKKQVNKIRGQFKISEQRYRNLIESSPDMIFVVNQAGKIFHMNREARFFIPVKSDGQENGPMLENLISSGENEKLDDFLSTVFTRQKASGEFHFKDRTKGYREIDIAAILLPREPGGRPRACLFARDVTQKNRIERDLVQADKMAIIGQMAADVAHEINNPIGIVRANIDVILARGWYSQEAKKFLESCKRNTVRAGEFTRDLLAVARPKTPEMSPLDLWNLVNATIELMGVQLKHIDIEKQTKGHSAVIEGDRNLIQQVLVNLLLNASAAMKDVRAPLINITCCVPQGADMVRLRVEDRGIGIPRKNLTQVFEPFFTQGKKEGFGLGLFISRRIIENHNGIIYAESQVEQGTQFIIELPLIKRHPA